MKKDVLVIFKTHLDIGYTDFAENVVNNYINEYIPNAIKVGYELKDTDTPFVWTTGSWLIYKALKEDKTGTVEKAVRDGILNWHALPFTTHTELMNPTLFEMGLDISSELDEKFGKNTIASKMTDVPGHTLGMIPRLCKRGVRFLHIGVNPATPLPPVPLLFKWKNRGDEIVVMYEGDYGCAREFDDFVVFFAHTGDNKGPQSKEAVTEVYENIRKQYPDSNIFASTLDDVAERVLKIENLPIIENEIGDTWIHGAATDPAKLSRYRRLLRYIEDNKINDSALRDNLLLVPEHTWGICVQVNFHDTEHYTYTELEDCVEARKKPEGTWLEQRAYVEKAEKLLGLKPDYDTLKPDLAGFSKINVHELDDYEISWQMFDNSDYERYNRDYLRLDADENEWVKWDFTKPGLPDYKGDVYTARVKEAYEKGKTKIYKLEFDSDVVREYGLPYFWLVTDGENIEIRQFDKKASRQPQASWFKFKKLDENFELNKLGEWIDPDNIVGSPLISAVEKGVRNKDVVIESLDAALVAPYGRKLLHYNEKDLKKDLYFNLYNNIWDTNFPLWYSDDALYRFKITKRDR